jgi:hypothetical protein
LNSSPARFAATPADADDRYGTSSAAGTTPAAVADARSSYAGAPASSLPPAGSPYTPSSGSAFGTAPASTPAGAYPSTGAAPAASDLGTPPYQPGSTHTGSFSPQTLNSLSPSSLSGASANSGVVPTSYERTSDARY